MYEDTLMEFLVLVSGINYILKFILKSICNQLTAYTQLKQYTIEHNDIFVFTVHAWEVETLTSNVACDQIIVFILL